MNVPTQTIRVTSVRAIRTGGALFVGVPIDPASGSVTNTKDFIVVNAYKAVLGGLLIQAGMWLEVEGYPYAEGKTIDGFLRNEIKVRAKRVTALRPSGEHLIRFLADNDSFEGIGVAKARRLWDTFGEGLYELLDQQQYEPLLKVLSTEAALALLRAWQLQGDSQTMQFLQVNDINLTVARSVVAFFGKEAKRKIEEDPYRLLSFSASWPTTDRLATSHFKIELNDPRRLLAACEEALYRLFNEGHTAGTTTDVLRRVKGLLGHRITPDTEYFIASSLEAGKTNGAYIFNEGAIQPIGAAILERNVAQGIVARLLSIKPPRLSVSDISRCIGDFEFVEGVELSPEQRLAVSTALKSGVSCITGGAGVGKTTVLKCLLAAFDGAGIPARLIALAGRAAKRITEATGRHACTIAAFVNSPDLDLLEDGVLIIDEASMVDVISMAQILAKLPRSCRLVMVGDDAQLMPVGPGLVFHELVVNPAIPKTELKVPKRFGRQIAEAANSVRTGNFPVMGNNSAEPVCFLQFEDKADVAECIIDLYDYEPKGCQVICARKGGRDGTAYLNRAIQERVNSTGAYLYVANDFAGELVNTGLRLGDIILCTRNLYKLDLRNGSLGTIFQLETTPTPHLDEDGNEIGLVIAYVEWDDGVRRPLLNSILDDIELGYAITVHKAQGSQWRRILMPIFNAGNLDRSMLYTGLTRAQDQVILVGSLDFATKATVSPPQANKRQTMLSETVNQQLHAAYSPTHAKT